MLTGLIGSLISDTIRLLFEHVEASLQNYLRTDLYSGILAATVETLDEISPDLARLLLVSKIIDRLFCFLPSGSIPDVIVNRTNSILLPDTASNLAS